MANAAANVLAGKLSALYPPGQPEIIKAAGAGIDLPAILTGKAVPGAAEIAKLKELKVPYEFSSFLGYRITNLYDFFMLFVIMSGIAAFLLFLLTSWLKKLMTAEK